MTPLTVYSIGHSNQPLESLLDLLRGAYVATLVDIRSQPYSRFSPQFNRRRLEAAVTAGGFRYVYAGDRLGGRPASEELYDDDGRVSYLRLSRSAPFLEGIDLLLDLSAQSSTAVMCSEEDPTNCHRRLLLGPVLKNYGVEMVHLRRNGKAQSGLPRTASIQPALPGLPSEWRSVSALRRPPTRRAGRS